MPGVLEPFGRPCGLLCVGAGGAAQPAVVFVLCLVVGLGLDGVEVIGSSTTWLEKSFDQRSFYHLFGTGEGKAVCGSSVDEGGKLASPVWGCRPPPRPLLHCPCSSCSQRCAECRVVLVLVPPLASRHHLQAVASLQLSTARTCRL